MSERPDAARDPGPPVRPAGSQEEVAERLGPFLELLSRYPASLSSVRDPEAALETHVADSLSGLAVEAVNESSRTVDIGSGGGFPGIPLAVVLPECDFTLIDSVGRKTEFLNQAVDLLGLENVEVMTTRSEDLAAGEGKEAFSVALARAVGPLSVLAELASPLLAEGGALVAWKGSRELDEEERLARLVPQLAMELEEVLAVQPFPGSRTRHLYVVRKAGPTPANLPRRPGMAKKRPLSE